MGGQRIVSKMGDSTSYGADPRRIPKAGDDAEGGIKPNYAAKFGLLNTLVKAMYDTFRVPYAGSNNSTYAGGQGFCCGSGQPGAGSAVIGGTGDNVEKMQYYYHPDHLGNTSFITNLDGEVAQYLEYLPFGETFMEKRLTNYNGTPYQFNGKELDAETNLYYYGARYYDPKGSLWISVDPLKEKYPGVSSYADCLNNPVKLRDPDGRGVKSIHIDPKGNVLRNINDGDNSVFVHAAGINGNDVDKTYTDKDHSAGGIKVGELGKTIDASCIIENVLSDNKSKGYTLWDWKDMVGLNKPWDYKNNKSTIFGIAWDFDKGEEKRTDNPDLHTIFNYKSYPMNAADFGNYNAGYTGTSAGIVEYLQKVGAGYYEIKKNGNWLQHWNPGTYFRVPYGDAINDYKWNTRGMNDAPKPPPAAPSPDQQTILHTMPFGG